VRGGPDDVRAGELCADAMRNAAAVAAGVAALFAPSKSGRAMPAAPATDVATDAPPASTEEALARLKLNAAELGELRRTHRSATLGAVASGTLTADAAMARVETVRSLEALARHAWRSAAHLTGTPE